MLHKFMLVAGFAIAMALSGGVAHADTLTGTTYGSSCAGCPAATYTLTVTGDFSTGTNLTVTLTIDFGASATITSANSYISAVSFKLGDTINAATLNLAPGTLSHWGLTGLDSGLGNDGCSGSGSGFACNQDNGYWTDAAVTQGGSLTWTWTGVNIGGPLNTDTSGWSIKVKYNDPIYVKLEKLDIMRHSQNTPGQY